MQLLAYDSYVFVYVKVQDLLIRVPFQLHGGSVMQPFHSLPVSRECLPHEPGRIEYYNQLYLYMWSSWGCV